MKRPVPLARPGRLVQRLAGSEAGEAPHPERWSM